MYIYRYPWLNNSHKAHNYGIEIYGGDEQKNDLRWNPDCDQKEEYRSKGNIEDLRKINLMTLTYAQIQNHLLREVRNPLPLGHCE